MSNAIQQQKIVYIRYLAAEWVAEELEREENTFGESYVRHKHYKNKIKYDNKLFSPEEFFKYLYPNEYKKYPYRVKFKGQLAKDIENLSANRRCCLIYDILEYHYPDLVEIDETEQQQIIELFSYCDNENNYAKSIYYKLQYKDGVRKVVTFGCGLKYNCKAHSKVCCYYITSGESMRIYHGLKMNWEEWEKAITYPIKHHIVRGYFPLPSYIAYYKSQIHFCNIQSFYTTIPIATKKILEQWINEMIETGDLIPIPLSGDTGSTERSFTVDFNDTEQIEIIQNVDMKVNTAQYNRDNNAAKGIERMRKRYTEILTAEQYTTKELEQLDIDKNARTRLIKSGLLLSGGRGVYLNNIK